MNWPVLIIVAAILIVLVVFLIRKNKKDEKELEIQLKNDYPKTKEESNNEETGEITG